MVCPLRQCPTKADKPPHVRMLGNATRAGHNNNVDATHNRHQGVPYVTVNNIPVRRQSSVPWRNMADKQLIRRRSGSGLLWITLVSAQRTSVDIDEFTSSFRHGLSPDGGRSLLSRNGNKDVKILSFEARLRPLPCRSLFLRRIRSVEAAKSAAKSWDVGLFETKFGT